MSNIRWLLIKKIIELILTPIFPKIHQKYQKSIKTALTRESQIILTWWFSNIFTNITNSGYKTPTLESKLSLYANLNSISTFISIY